MDVGPGWHPDPDDPAGLRWWDGQQWTEHRSRPEPAAPTPTPTPTPAMPQQPPVLPAPPPFGGPPPFGDPAPFPPAAPIPPRSRRGLLIVIGVLAVVVLGAGAFVVLSADDPEFTFDGEEFAEPEAALLAAEESMEALVEQRHGQLVDDSRCYFSSPGGDDVDRESDVEDFLRCGPVLFVDDDPDAPWLRYALEDREDRDGNLLLEPRDDPESQDPEALEDDEILRRPDDLEPPPNDGGIEAPDPPPGEPDLFEVTDLEGVDLDSIEPARIVSFTESIEVTAIGQPERIGRDDDARSAALGQRLVAFEGLLGLGEGVAAPAAEIGIQIGTAAPVPLPAVFDTAFEPTTMLLSVDEDETVVDIVVTELGVEQRISLVTGEPAAGNVQVTLRENVEQTIGTSQVLEGRVTLPGVGSASDQFTVTINAVNLVFFAGIDGAIQPSGPDRALLLLDQRLDSQFISEDDNTALGPGVFSLVLPDGTVLTAINIATEANLVLVAIDVPAGFTAGTLVVTGVDTDVETGGTLDFGAARFEIPLSIPAG